LAVDVWGGISAHAAPGVEAQVLDIAAGLTSLGAAAFDVVLASNVLEHFEPDAAARVAAGVATVLRPGGRFIVIQPNFRLAFRRYFDDYTHRSVFTDRSLPALLKASGLQIEQVRARFLPYSMQERRVPVWPWLVRAYLESPVKPFAGQMLVVARRD
jgi:SAM-dependent methyltransferase